MYMQGGCNVQAAGGAAPRARRAIPARPGAGSGAPGAPNARPAGDSPAQRQPQVSSSNPSRHRGRRIAPPALRLPGWW
jgi:hypothetical protein